MSNLRIDAFLFFLRRVVRRLGFKDTYSIEKDENFMRLVHSKLTNIFFLSVNNSSRQRSGSPLALSPSISSPTLACSSILEKKARKVRYQVTLVWGKAYLI